MDLKKYDQYVINNADYLIKQKNTGLTMMALAPAYLLSIAPKDFDKKKKAALIKVIENICDTWSDTMEKEFASYGPHCTSEWEIMSICQIKELIGNTLNKKKLNRWKKWADEYCKAQLKRPFYYTSYNHEIMRCAAISYFGKVFQKPSYREQSKNMAKQLLNFASPLGFYEEGPHHGPSMKYNYIMLHGLAWMTRFSKDKNLEKATAKLADLMATYAYPDGSTMGPLDGRQTSGLSSRLGLQCGLELSNKGTSLQRKNYSTTYDNAIKENDPEFMLRYFSISSAIYFKSFKIKWLKEKQIPLDKNCQWIESSPDFKALVKRKGKWVCCLSAHNSHIPKETKSVFRLERQSRIELWHKDLGLVIGGGHNKYGNKTPYANCMASTGYLDQDFDFGLIKGKDQKANHAMYYARSIKVSFESNHPTIELFFAHYTLKFTVLIVSDKKIKINWQLEHHGVNKIAIQIPIVVPKNGVLISNKKEIKNKYKGNSKLTKGKQFAVQSKERKAFTVKSNGSCGIRHSNMPLITYVEDEADFFDKVPYHIAMLSNQIIKPKKKCSGTFDITIK
ncbi:MAG: hypothetical protein COA79_14120 [Planctomycetota bacterium]|nr:MAG: hypothetical protein COA79_14120 [Planctomycetota bacterium]